MSTMIQMTAAQAINLALREEMRRNPDVFLMGEGSATKHRDLVDAFGPDRVRNTPLAEAIIAGTAVGAAASGLRPVILFSSVEPRFLCWALTGSGESQDWQGFAAVFCDCATVPFGCPGDVRQIQSL